MIIADQVMGWMAYDTLLPDEAAGLELSVSATNSYVESLPGIDRELDGSWADTTTLGAIMYAARLYKRKNSPGGIEAAGETVTYVSRWDSDINRLLCQESFRKPLIG